MTRRTTDHSPTADFGCDFSDDADVMEFADRYSVVLDARGVGPSQAAVGFEGGLLVVRRAEDGAVLCEVSLPADADPAGMTVRTEYGLLVVEVPRAAPEAVARA